jgi:hypothetical protein
MYITSQVSQVTKITLYLIAFFRNDDFWPRVEYKPVYLILLSIIALGTEGGESDLGTFEEIMKSIK